MNARLSLLSAAFLSLAFCSPAGAVTVELFHETFDGNDQNWSYTSSGARSYDKSWTEADTVKPGYKGIKLGSTSVTGAITSESFSISNTAADVSIVVIAAAYQNNGGGKEGIAVTVYDSTDTQIYAGGVEELTQHSSTAKDEIPTTAAFTHEFTVPAASLPASGGIYMKIESTYTKSAQQRALLGDVLVTQTYSTGLPKLATPVLSDPSTNYTGFVFSWNSVTHATNGYTVTLSPAAGNVTVSGTTATVTGLEEGTTYTASVVANGDGTGTDDSEEATLSVTTLTAPAVTAPVLTPSAVSPSSFTVSWPAQTSASFSIRAWTLVPADSATEDFADFPTVSGWTFNTDLDTYNDDDVKIKLDATGESVVSPTYPGVASSLSFKLKGNSANGSSVSVLGSADGSTWTELTNIVFTTSTKVNEIVLSNMDNLGMTSFKWEFTKVGGGAGFGSVSVTGTGVGKARSYLEGYGSDAAGVAVGGTSVTVSNPVSGATNYVEVTATGLTGRTASSKLGVPVPGRPCVIAVK